MVDNGGVELVRVRKVEVKPAAMFEPLGAQGALVETPRRMEDEGVVLEFAVMGSSENAVWAVESWQERRHAPVGERGCV